MLVRACACAHMSVCGLCFDAFGISCLFRRVSESKDTEKQQTNTKMYMLGTHPPQKRTDARLLSSTVFPICADLLSLRAFFGWFVSLLVSQTGFLVSCLGEKSVCRSTDTMMTSRD